MLRHKLLVIALLAGCSEDPDIKDTRPVDTGVDAIVDTRCVQGS